MEEPNYSFDSKQCPWYILSDRAGKVPIDISGLKAFLKENHPVIKTISKDWRQSAYPDEIIILQTDKFRREAHNESANFIGLKFQNDNAITLNGEPPPPVAKKIIDAMLEKYPFPSKAYISIFCGHEYQTSFEHSPQMSLAEFESLVSNFEYLDGSKPELLDFSSNTQTPPLPELYKNGAPQYFPPWWPFETMALHYASAAPEKVPLAPDRNSPNSARHLLEGAAKALMARYTDLANVPAKPNPEFITKIPEPAKVQPVLPAQEGRVVKSPGRFVYHGPTTGAIKPEDERYKIAFSHDHPLEQQEAGTPAALRQLLPIETADMTDTQLENLLNASKSNAAAHGLSKQPDTLNWAVLSLLCGPDFDQEPYVNALLQMEYIPETYRLSYLVSGLNYVLRDRNLTALQYESISTIVWIDKSKTPKDENPAHFKPSYYYISRMVDGQSLTGAPPLFPDSMETRFEAWLRKNFKVTYFHRYRYEDSKTNIEQFDLRDESLEKYGIFDIEGQFNFDRASLRFDNAPAVFAARFIEAFAEEFSDLDGIFVGGGFRGSYAAKHLALERRDNWLELLSPNAVTGASSRHWQD